MSIYPFDIDDDSTIGRIDDNITEIGGDVINSLRDAMFAVQKEMGIQPSGSVSSIADRLNKSLTSDGDIKASAIASLGLVTLPIDNAQVGINAGIAESKLSLDYSTSDLNTLIQSNSTLLNSINSFLTEVGSNLNTHISGGALLINGSPGRHVASHIDINATPFDTRDATFTWTGLLDKNGNARSAENVAAALLEINNDFTSHQNATSDGHNASAIDINVDNFITISPDIDDVQKFVEYVDNVEILELGEHRATQHRDSVLGIARSESVTEDGYGYQNIVPSTSCQTYLVRSPNTTPVDDISTGDDIVKFFPDNTGFFFDSQFEKVQNGDIIRVNYGNGIEAVFYVESVKFVPGSTWSVRINGTNLADADSDGYAVARIDRPRADRNTAGVLSVAAANATPVGSFDTILSSVIIGNPRGANALGLDFNPGQLDATHYNLYIDFYPTGNPADRVISLPAIDVTGNAGATAGKYTLQSVVQATNDKLREIGYNLRLIAYANDGEFGIMMADAINNAGFAIIKGANVSGTLVTGSFTNNVIGEDRSDGFDALGFGSGKIDLASVPYLTSFTDANDAAQLNNLVIPPAKKRYYVANGRKLDYFADTWMANSDGYWDGYISARTPVGTFTVETTYQINLDLKASGIKSGMTIVVQPTVDFSDSSYFDVDYGRFIVKNVNFIPACPGESEKTLITVINGLHAEGTGYAFSSGPSLPVRIYFSQDSVSFNNQNLIDTAPTGQDYRRHHEIYVTDEGKTFSHERARMPVHAEDTGPSGATNYLATSNWHIESVSSKLRGYKDLASTYNKFVRLYILNYNVDTGEYDGYIGQRVSGTSSITKVGPRTVGRKNVPTKFYDETNIDYIEICFDETSGSSPGISILSDATTPAPIGGDGTARYVDIEVFDSLSRQDEVFLLATCEVNWDPSPAGTTQIVQRVADRREFGSIGVDEFSSEAIDFVTAGDRFLHENGVLRGLDFDYINPSDNREIFYKGGFALVNGKVVPVNATSVTIPEIHEDGDAPPPDKFIDWAVCVNESGTLEPILLTTTKQQFFAKDRSSGNVYYIPSVTFAELVETRKDLTSIATVTATIGSIIINSSDVLDVRRFVDDGKNRNLVFSPTDFVGTFHTAAALKSWVNNYGSLNPLIAKVRGNFDIESSVDLTGFNYPIILDGDGAIFNVTTNQGFLIDNNVTLHGITFNYNPSSPPSYLTDDKINSDNGCIYHGSGSDVVNVIIENCKFNSSVTTQRPPFISFQMEKGDAIENLQISNNSFNDVASDPAEDQAAIAIIGLNTGVSSDPALIINSKISGNLCDNHQGIYLTQERDSTGTPIKTPGVSVVNTTISDNNCGVIGILASAQESVYALDTRTDRSQGLTIRNNTCHVIANITNGDSSQPGTYFVTMTNCAVPSGSIQIDSNSCHWIRLVVGQDDGSNETGHILITNNRLTAYDQNYWDQYDASAPGSSYAITVLDNANLDQIEVTISDNSISPGLFDATPYEYDIGIFTRSSSNVVNNTIKGLAASGVGIFADTYDSSSLTGNYLITNNKIYRGTTSINYYMQLDTGTGSNGIVKDNYLDNYTVDGGSDDEVITGTGETPGAAHSTNWIITGNKNQTGIIYLGWLQGAYTDGSGFIFPITQPTNLIITGGGTGSTWPNGGSFWDAQIEASGGSVSSVSSEEFWHIDQFLPYDSYMVRAEMSIEKVSTSSGTASWTLYNATSETTSTGSPSFDFGAQSIGSGGRVTSVITTGDKTYRAGKTLRLSLDFSSLSITSSIGLYASSPYIIYRW